MYFHYEIPEAFQWFPESRYGMFIHWGPYAALERGEQVLFREHLNQREYELAACKWNPKGYDAREWVKIMKEGGFRYACLTTRHHDGYCLWDSKYTNYTSMKQAPGRDFVREYVDAMHEAGLKVGFYYSWCDFRIPAYYEGPEKNPEGYQRMKEYIHGQVEELCTKYGKIDYFFFDGVWPRCAKDLDSPGLVAKMRKWQPGIMINNRLGYSTDPEQLLRHGGGFEEGDFGTPEHLVNPENRLWESNQVSFWRWWGYHGGERHKTAPELLDLLCSCVSKGGNLLINVGPDGDGHFPKETLASIKKIGAWMNTCGEALYGNQGGALTDAVTFGYETMKDQNLYLIFRFWRPGQPFRLADLINPVEEVTLLNTGEKLPFEKKGEDLWIYNLPDLEEELFPVIRVACKGRPETNSWGSQVLWEGDPLRIAQWARDQRGENAEFNVEK